MTKFFLKATVAAALAASGVAQAAIATGSFALDGSVDSELVFTLYDDSKQVSYALDLGVTTKAFRLLADLTRQTGTLGEGNAAGSPTSSKLGYSQTWNLAGDSQFASFLNTASPDTSNWRFFVTGADNAGSTTAYNARTAVTTVSADRVSGLADQKNGAFITGAGAVSTYFDALNQLGTNGTVANGSAYGTVANGGYALGGTFVGNNGGTFFSFSTDSGIGDKAAVFFLARKTGQGTSNGTAAAYEQFDNDVNPGYFTVSKVGADYAVSYTLAAAVPEPGTYALMAAGLLLVGGIARRRRG